MTDVWTMAADLFDPRPAPSRWACDRADCDGAAHVGWPWPHARTNQRAPAGDWLVWLILAGRGFGKTRTGAEWAADRARNVPGALIALVAATFADGRDTMVEGESGLLSVLDDGELLGGSRERAWNRSLGELFMANGSHFKIFTSERPSRLRGPQHHYAWGDEAASWIDADRGLVDDTTWSNLMLTLRLGQNPQVVVTTTPKPVGLLRGTRSGGRNTPGLIELDNSVVTRGSTYENLANLAPTFRAAVLSLYEGTRLGRQELLAELLDDVEGALWTSLMIEQTRLHPDSHRGVTLGRTVVGVDPAVTSGPDADETGILIGARMDRCPFCPQAEEPHALVLEDVSMRGTPEAWARAVVAGHRRWDGDRVVGEVNNGGELVESVLRAVDANLPYRSVHASRGKRVRAEPVQALYEKRRVHHVGIFPLLEDQMTSWVPDVSTVSPDRLDALVWLLTELLLGDGDVTRISVQDHRLSTGRRAR